MPVLTQTLTQTISGEALVFSLAVDPLLQAATGPVTITIGTIGVDLDGGTFGSEDFDIFLEGQPGIFDIDGAEATGQFSVSGNNVTLDFTTTLSAEAFNAAIADGFFSATIQLDFGVNIFLGGAQQVEVTIAYAGAPGGTKVAGQRLFGAQVLVFDDPAFVGTGGTSFDESDTIQSALTSIGATVTTLASTSSAALGAALVGKTAVVFPEFENGAFTPSAAFVAELRRFVAEGGTLLIAGEAGGNDESFLNTVFGYGLVDGSGSAFEGSTLDPVAVDYVSTLEGAPATLPGNNAIYAQQLASLPSEAEVFYTTNAGEAAVWAAPFGAGQVAFVAWDWFNGAPLGPSDGGWNDVLGRLINSRAVEDDLPATTATPATIAADEPPRTVNFEVANDADWVRLAVRHGVTYTIDLSDFGSVDPFLRLLTAGGVVLAADDNSGSDFFDDARIVFTATADGDLFIEASDVSVFGAFSSTDSNQFLTVTDDLSTLTAAGESATFGAGVDKVDGLAGNDNLNGGGGNDILFGGADNDTLNGGANDDKLSGDAGDDVLQGSSGNDRLLGGAGFDTADYGALGTAVTLRSGGVVSKGALGTDTLGGFDVATGTIETLERVVGAIGLRNVIDGTSVVGAVNQNVNLAAGTFSSTVVVPTGGFPAGATFAFQIANFTDVLGTENNDTVTGSAAGNFITGAGGDDLIIGSAGNDSLIGGAGFDTVDYSGLGTAVTLRSGGVAAKGALGTDALGTFDFLTGAIEVFERVVGAAGQRNVIDGTSVVGAVNQTVDLAAGTFSSTVVAPAGGFPAGATFGFQIANFVDVLGTENNDTVIGSIAANLITGAGGNDSLSGGDGNDTLDGGAGNDTLTGGVGNDSLTGGVGVDTVDYLGTAGALSVNLNLAGGQNTLGAGIDTLTGLENINGGNGADTLTGDGVANRIDGSNGNDSVIGNGGDDTLLGGAGVDTLRGLVGADSLSGGGDNDTLDGGAENDTLDGGAGNDSLVGGDGADSLLGLDGNDTLNGGGGGDTLNGGVGVDTAAYAGTAGAVAINLNLGGAQNTVSAGLDVLTNIEDVLGGNGADTLTGNGVANRIDGSSGDDTVLGGGGGDTLLGGAGNDTLRGEAGTDSLLGGDGNDVLDGGAGNDTLNGGGGTDTASYLGTVGGVAVNLNLVGGQNTIGAGLDTLNAIANLIGGDGLDTLTGNGVANQIDGSNGNDSVLGNGGDDTLLGSAGNDTLRGLAGADSLSGGNDNDLLDGGTENDTLDGGAGNDSLLGGDGADSLNGGDGNDTLTGGAGDDTLNGGGGTDTASYLGNAAAVSVNLNIAGAQNTIGAGFDTFIAIANINGGNGADTLTGSNFANQIDGSTGNDSVIGNGGDDTVLGGGGNDTLRGNAGADSLTGGDGLDVLDGGSENDTLDGGVGADRLIGGTGQDTLIGGADSDTFEWNSVAESTFAAPDVISGGFLNPGAAAGDLIDLIDVDANSVLGGIQNFVFGVATGIGRLWALDDAGSTDTLIFGNVDGVGNPDLTIRIQDGAGVLASAYTAADFLV